ncbi:MAG: hypothetical protein ACRC7O_16430 [Fimbriiglobus sp.]
MATFYVLPPRECLEQAVAEFVGRVIPGLPVPPAVADALFVALAADDVFFVHREDLPGFDHLRELTVGFGAEPGDAVVDVGLATTARPAAVRHTMIPSAVPVTAFAR